MRESSLEEHERKTRERAAEIRARQHRLGHVAPVSAEPVPVEEPAPAAPVPVEEPAPTAPVPVEESAAPVPAPEQT